MRKCFPSDSKLLGSTAWINLPTTDKPPPASPNEMLGRADNNFIAPIYYRREQNKHLNVLWITQNIEPFSNDLHQRVSN